MLIMSKFSPCRLGFKERGISARIGKSDLVLAHLLLTPFTI